MTSVRRVSETALAVISIGSMSRALLQGYFPLPDIPGCINYAIEEAGETRRILNKLDRPEDKRNNKWEATLEGAREEWGQCGYMIISALIQCSPEQDYKEKIFDGNSSFHNCLAYLCDAYAAHVEDLDSEMDQDYDSSVKLLLYRSLTTWIQFCGEMGWEAEELILETGNKFENKYII